MVSSHVVFHTYVLYVCKGFSTVGVSIWWVSWWTDVLYIPQTTTEVETAPCQPPSPTTRALNPAPAPTTALTAAPAVHQVGKHWQHTPAAPCLNSPADLWLQNELEAFQVYKVQAITDRKMTLFTAFTNINGYLYFFYVLLIYFDSHKHICRSGTVVLLTLS